jgi:hypothetical protein
MNRIAIAAIPLVAILTGCAATTATSAPPAAAGSPSASALAAPSPSASVMCTTNACVASDIEQSLLGQIAKDNAVATKVVCPVSSVKANAGQTWTASCRVTESDGTVSEGYGNFVESSDQVTYDPQTVLSGG